MNKSIKTLYKKLLFCFFFLNSILYAQDNAPKITAEGNQAFCIGTEIPIVTDFTITDADDVGIEKFFIQISKGYINGFDFLELKGDHPTINQSWSSGEGKLTLSSAIIGSEILFSDLEKALKEVVFSTVIVTVFEEKVFSLSVDDANYLPATDHFYEFISDQGISWKKAKEEAEKKYYYGRQGYLATLTSQTEADFAGKQASGAGWIGGSDEETEGVWKWVTGPEAGEVFWNGNFNGATNTYANWNHNEPNNSNNEDYAHITDPSIGIVGAWNDLPNEGGTGKYIPRGYIVEYGTPEDPPLSIVATTRIYIPQTVSTTPATLCVSGIAEISASSNVGEILWYDALINGNFLFEGDTYTTPNLTSTTTYYATISVGGCTTLPRTAVTVTVNPKPTITSTKNDLICAGTANLSATASAGMVFWYDSATSTTPIFKGNNFETPSLTNTTSYFVEANISDCVSAVRTEVVAVVDATIPDFDLLQETVVLCADVGSITLKTINAQGNYSYVWKKEGTIISGDIESLTVDSSGTYSVTAISEAGCQSEEKIISVHDSEKATITNEDILIIDDSENNSIQVINLDLGSGNYEFAINNEFGSYKNEGYFDNLSTGIHTLFIRDKGGCGTEKYVFSVIGYPKFFTPNDDGKNDVWNIAGFDRNFYTVSEIRIFDRFGNFIYKIDAGSLGWNGIAKGKIMPTNTYWFKAILTDINGVSTEKTGNFSLIRK